MHGRQYMLALKALMDSRKKKSDTSNRVIGLDTLKRITPELLSAIDRNLTKKMKTGES